MIDYFYCPLVRGQDDPVDILMIGPIPTAFAIIIEYRK